MAKSTTERALATNRRARYDYAIGETFEAGIALLGSEIKSAREGRMTIAEGYVYIKNGEAWLENAHIPHYPPAGIYGQHEPTRARKLLLKKKVQENYPLSLYHLLWLTFYQDKFLLNMDLKDQIML